MALAGVHHITIAPELLRDLAKTRISTLKINSIFDNTSSGFKAHRKLSFLTDEPGYRIAFTRSQSGEGERKLSQVRADLIHP
jgi:transaldolase